MNKVQEALKAAIEELEAQGIFSTADLCKSALAEIGKCEPVGETVETLEHWLSINMPAGTVIGDPLWWARKIRNVIAYTSHQPIEKREPKPEYKLSSDGKSVVFVNYRELVDIENDKLNKRHTAPQPIEKCEPVTDTYVQLVPDKCDRIVYKNRYYSLDLLTSPISKEWVGLSDQQIQNLIINSDNYNKFQFIKSVEHTVKQLNAEKG